MRMDVVNRHVMRIFWKDVAQARYNARTSLALKQRGPLSVLSSTVRSQRDLERSTTTSVKGMSSSSSSYHRSDHVLSLIPVRGCSETSPASCGDCLSRLHGTTMPKSDGFTRRLKALIMSQNNNEMTCRCRHNVAAEVPSRSSRPEEDSRF